MHNKLLVIFFFIVEIVLSQSLDPKVEIEIDMMLKSMSVEEKVGQMTQIALSVLEDKDKSTEGAFVFDEEKLRQALLQHHVGSILNTTGGAFSVEQWNAIITKIQDVALETDKKIPVIYGIDAIHGATFTKDATLFPHNIGLAATRNLDLVTKTAKITAMETRASGIRWDFDPVLDIGRQPLWPGFPETYGEDPYITTQMGKTAVEAYEGGGLDQPTSVASCMKHFIGYSGAASGKDRTPAYIPDVILREYYLPSFEEAIKSGASTIMINSASVNGVPIHGSHYYLTELLRDQLGFEGAVITDWEDVKRLHTRHLVAETPKEAVRMAVMAGIDMSMVPSDFSFYDYLVELVNEGKVPESRIDKSVRILLRLKHRLGLFKNPYPEKEAIANFGKSSYDDVALEAAHESIILLKNDQNALPLSKKEKVLVVGPTGDSHSALNGGWSFSWQGNIEENYPERYLTLIQAIEEKVGAKNVIHGSRFGFTNERNYDIEEFLREAKEVDRIILCLGEDAYSASPGVINDLTLPSEQLELAFRMIETGKPVVLVMIDGRPRIFDPIVQHIDGIVLANRPGSKGGEAIADVLFGDYNPNGVLPYSYPRHTGDIVFYDRKFLANVQQLKLGSITYHGYNPEWEFGHGLSYTTFAYSGLTLSSKNVKPGEDLKVKVKVTNTGDLDGKVAVDLYLSDLFASLSPSVKRLKRFQKVFLKRGETKELTFTLTTRDLEFYGPAHKWIYEPGAFKITIGTIETTFQLVLE